MKLYEIIRSVTWTRLKKKIHELFPESEASMKYIDLGLPFLVADRNIGAENPEDYGIFFNGHLLDCTRETGRDSYVIHRNAGRRRSSGGAPMVAMRPVSGDIWMPVRTVLCKLK